MRRFFRFLAVSAVGRYVLFPYRLVTAYAATCPPHFRIWRWLLASREWTNFTYGYSRLCRERAIEIVSVICGEGWAAIRDYADELENDALLNSHYETVASSRKYRHLLDPHMRLSRQLVYYLVVRALKPAVVVEAGCDRGLGSVVIASALIRNSAEGSPGHLHTIDHNERSGFLLSQPYDEVATFHRTASTAFLERFDGAVDFFVHDTSNDDAHVREQLRLLAKRLHSRSIVLTTWFSDAFVDFCRVHGFRFLEFAEQPDAHWYKGARLGFVFRPGVS